MKTTQKLVQLLATLQPDEKRHLNKVLDRNGDGTQARQLYDLLFKHLKEDEFGRAALNIDEEQLVFRLQREGVNPGLFHVVRNNLQNGVLKALRQLNEEHNKVDEIHKLMRDAQILEKRGMFNWAEEMLNEAVKIAKKYQYHALTIESLTKQVELIRQMNISDYADRITAAVNEMERTLQHYREEVDIFSKTNQIAILYKTYKGLSANDLNQKIQEFLSCPGIAEPDSAHSFRSKVTACRGRGMVVDLSEGHEAAHKWFEANMQLWHKEENRHFREEYTRDYIVNVNNYLAFCIATQNYQSYLKYISLLENFKPGNFNDRAELFHTLHFLKQLYYLNTGKLEEMREIIPSTINGLIKYAFKINKPRLMLLIYHIHLTYFALGDYKALLESHKNTLQMWQGADLRTDTKTAIRFLVLIAHIELDNFEELDKFIKQVKPTLNTEVPNPDYERIVLIHLLALADTIVHPLPDARANAEKEKEIMKKFCYQLEQYQASTAPHLTSGLQEIVYWLKSKIDGDTFLDQMFKK